jgi:hypothetical protein
MSETKDAASTKLEEAGDKLKEMGKAAGEMLKTDN